MQSTASRERRLKPAATRQKAPAEYKQADGGALRGGMRVLVWTVLFLISQPLLLSACESPLTELRRDPKYEYDLVVRQGSQYVVCQPGQVQLVDMERDQLESGQLSLWWCVPADKSAEHQVVYVRSFRENECQQRVEGPHLFLFTNRSGGVATFCKHWAPGWLPFLGGEVPPTREVRRESGLTALFKYYRDYHFRENEDKIPEQVARDFRNWHDGPTTTYRRQHSRTLVEEAMAEIENVNCNEKPCQEFLFWLQKGRPLPSWVPFRLKPPSVRGGHLKLRCAVRVQDGSVMVWWFDLERR